jgi:hypothetical protein
LIYQNSSGGNALVKLSWSSPSTSKTVIPQSQLYPDNTYVHYVQAFTLLNKVALLINTFKMTAKEVAYFSNHGADFAGIDPVTPAVSRPFDFNALPMSASGYTPALFNQWNGCAISSA